MLTPKPFSAVNVSFKGGTAKPQQVPPYLLRTPSGIFLITNEMETIQSHLLQRGSFEPLASALAAAISVERPGLVVDVGANIGTFSVPVALRNPNATIVAFEPQSGVYLQLCANIVLNRLLQIKPYRLAVSASEGTIKVPAFDPYVERYTGSVTLDPAVADIRGAIAGVAEPALNVSAFDQVDVVVLSNFLGEQLVSLLKIDVEGMELEVLKGARGLIERSQPVIFSECWSLSEFSPYKARLIEYIVDLDYQIREFGDDFIAVPRKEFDKINAIIDRTFR